MRWEPRWDDCEDEVAVHTDGRRLGMAEAADLLNRLEATVAALVAAWPEVLEFRTEWDGATHYRDMRDGTFHPTREAAVFAAAGIEPEAKAGD